MTSAAQTKHAQLAQVLYVIPLQEHAHKNNGVANINCKPLLNFISNYSNVLTLAINHFFLILNIL